MVTPLLTPRVNNNDDTVRLIKVLAEVGASVCQGTPIADIETEKAVFTVEAEQDGYLLAFTAKEGDEIAVGSTLAWIGSDPHESIPSAPAALTSGISKERQISLKAALLLSQYGLNASQVTHAAETLTAEDVQAYIESHGLELDRRATAPIQNKDISPPSSGKRVRLTPDQAGMLRTVEWHREQAAAAYLEISYNSSTWETYARDFRKLNKLAVSPLVSLMAWRLVQLAKEHPEINCTLSRRDKYVYDHVNLGFLVQVGERLSLVVVQEAEQLGEVEFVKKLSELQQSALNNTLRPEQISGATIAMSSMARWPVTRHVPILAPHTALMIAHTAPVAGTATLGATYDHRVLSGADAVRVLQALGRAGTDAAVT
ncbi:MAG TPA: 2-oxo acid dehydrogenase subunit E2 [Bryobacteraceae bacterium]|nr:2-oxo acid dehydrogenase subunit E2 [Bryobacteraceae bacterium]